MPLKAPPPPWPGAKITIEQSHRNKGDKKVRWRIAYRDHTGKRQRIVMGTRDQAEDAAAPLRVQAYEAKAFGRRPPPAALPSMTFAELSRMHLARTASQKSARDYASQWPRIVEWFGAETPIDSVTPSKVQDFRTWLLTLPSRRERGDDRDRALALRTGADPWGARPRLSPLRANRYMSTLQGAFTLAIRDKRLAENPVDSSHFSKEEPRTRVPVEDEFARVLARLSREARLAAIIASETCLRQESIAELTWDRVDIERRKMHVETTKAGVPVKVPISLMLRAALIEWRALRPAAEPRLFTLTKSQISDQWHWHAGKAGATGLRFHDLRRMAATKLLSAGVPLDMVMKIGGWTKPTTLLRIYASINDDRLADALRKIDAFDAKTST